MRGMLFLLVAIAACGCLMQPYSGVEVKNVSNNTSAVQPPPQPACLGPVCGADGLTYDTDCEAYNARVAIAYVGECLPPEPPCNDSDGGVALASAGTVAKGNETHADYCLDQSQLVEYSCLEGKITMATVQCGEGKECAEGMCANRTSPARNDSLQPCLGISEPDIYIRQSVAWNGTNYSDVCVDFRTVKDYFCRGQELASINHQCEPGYGCTNGQCNQFVLSCSDTDGGNDTTARGKVTGVRGLATVSEDFDSCADVQFIREYLCLENGSVAYSEFSCGSGKKCSDGKCVWSACTETDGGKDAFSAGTVTLDNEDHEDSCDDRRLLREFYCFGDGKREEIIACPQGHICNNGKCVEGSVS